MPKFVVLCGILALIIIAARSICASLVSQGVTRQTEKTTKRFTVLPSFPSSRAGTPDPPTPGRPLLSPVVQSSQSASVSRPADRLSHASAAWASCSGLSQPESRCGTSPGLSWPRLVWPGGLCCAFGLPGDWEEGSDVGVNERISHRETHRHQRLHQSTSKERC
uniref:Putative secreted protein n=1 Tax=Ixodes ricinus TaxID=34613 RepID=A0A6B0UY28_IXORI